MSALLPICMNTNNLLRVTRLGTSVVRYRLAAFLVLAALLAGPARAEVGNGISGLFTVDTRYGFSLGAGVSGFFSVDTRHSGWSGEGMSGLFTVDTRGATTGPAVITVPPQTLITAPGGTVTFSVTAAGNDPLFYQWRRNGANISAATGPSFSLSAVSAADAGDYSVVVWNVQGSDVSTAAQLILLQQTNRQTTVVEVGRSTADPDSQLRAYTNGAFYPASLVATNLMTIVMTHGWNSSYKDWPTAMAALFTLSGGTPVANIMAWHWEKDAASVLLPIPLSKIPAQGDALAKALLDKLGPDYSQPIHFIGHSLGTLVSARAADYLHGDGARQPTKGVGAFQPANTHMTLFDEAELAPEFMNDLLSSLAGSIIGVPVAVHPFYGSAMPKRSRWADNYVSAVGLLHSDAANVILTKGLPGYEPNVSAWTDAIKAFHSYPREWYSLTVPLTSAALMGNQWSFEQSGFAAAPATNSVFLQTTGVSPLDLTTTDMVSGARLLDSRFRKEAGWLGIATAGTLAQTVVQVSGQVSGGLGSFFFPMPTALFMRLQTVPHGSLFAPGGLSSSSPKDSGGTNAPACAWIPLAVPSNAVSMSFEFVVEGDGQDDSFAVALGGSNLLSLALSLVQTNVPTSSGLISVSEWAGQTVELFLGVVGGTSTNTSLTVGGINFYALVPPSLQAQAYGTDLVLTWPVAADGYVLESSASLTGTNSWTPVTNVPVIVDFQSTVTNSASGGGGFYRLKKVR